jgi:serine/threonine protein kinase
VLATETVVGGRYRLGPVIGRGGGADVFRADDLDSGRLVAVKVLRAASPDDLRRFDVEAQTLARLDDPAIVRMCDRGIHDGVPYLVLDLIDGEPLSDRLLRGSLSEGDVMRIGAVLAAALAHAHALGVVHRDVKPGNVLFDADGNVHLTDFGIARFTDATAVTAAGLVIGTAAYLSPEQVTGDRVGPASDIYSLGLVLLEALTGDRAFVGMPTEAALARLHRSPEVPPTASPALAMLLTSMTALDPESRPTASAVADSLTADATAVLPVASDVTAAIPVTAPVASMAPAAPAAHRRRPLVPVLVAAGIVLMFVIGWLTSGGRIEAPATAVTPTTGAPAPTTAPSTTAPIVAQTVPATKPPTRGKKSQNDNGNNGD